MEKTENKVPGISGSPTSVLAKIDAFRVQTNRSRVSRPRAVSMVEKYAVDIRLLHAAGRPQEDALLLIEMEEGKLWHKPDTLRKAINKIIPDWRQTANIDPEVSNSSRVASTRPFEDARSQGGQQW